MEPASSHRSANRGFRLLAITAGSMLVLLILIPSLLSYSGSRAGRIALDGLLSSNRIDRIIIWGEKADGSLETRTFSGEQIAPLLRQFGPTNRIRGSVFGKSKISATVTFLAGEVEVGGIGYFGREQVFDFGYRFKLRTSNAVSDLRGVPYW